jgi:hypothetical protein
MLPWRSSWVWRISRFGTALLLGAMGTSIQPLQSLSLQNTQDVFSPKSECRVDGRGQLSDSFIFQGKKRSLTRERQKLRVPAANKKAERFRRARADFDSVGRWTRRSIRIDGERSCRARRPLELSVIGQRSTPERSFRARIAISPFDMTAAY